MYIHMYISLYTYMYIHIYIYILRTQQFGISNSSNSSVFRQPLTRIPSAADFLRQRFGVILM